MLNWLLFYIFLSPLNNYLFNLPLEMGKADHFDDPVQQIWAEWAVRINKSQLTNCLLDHSLATANGD